MKAQRYLLLAILSRLLAGETVERAVEEDEVTDLISEISTFPAHHGNTFLQDITDLDLMTSAAVVPMEFVPVSQLTALFDRMYCFQRVIIYPTEESTVKYVYKCEKADYCYGISAEANTFAKVSVIPSSKEDTKECFFEDLGNNIVILKQSTESLTIHELVAIGLPAGE